VVPAEHQKIRAPGDNRAENSLIPAYIIHTADVINIPIVYIQHEKSLCVIHSLDNSFISHPPTRNTAFPRKTRRTLSREVHFFGYF
jgi:hypothetical protein